MHRPINIEALSKFKFSKSKKLKRSWNFLNNIFQEKNHENQKKKDEVIRKCEVCQAYHRGECPPERLAAQDSYDSGSDMNK